MRYAGKPLARKAFKWLDKSLGSYVDREWDRQHKVWVVNELRELLQRHGVSMGGEGVSAPAAAGNFNQFPPEGNFSQCASKVTLNSPWVETDSETRHDMDEWGKEALKGKEGGLEVVAVEEQKAVALEWPAEAELRVVGYCTNPRLLACELAAPDGRRVSMFRGQRNWRAGDKVPAKLTQGGGSPIYSER